MKSCREQTEQAHIAVVQKIANTRNHRQRECPTPAELKVKFKEEYDVIKFKTKYDYMDEESTKEQEERIERRKKRRELRQQRKELRKGKTRSCSHLCN